MHWAEKGLIRKKTNGKESVGTLPSVKPYFRGLFTSHYWGGGRGAPSHIHSQITDDPLSLALTLGFFIPFYRRIWDFFIIHSRSLPALPL